MLVHMRPVHGIPAEPSPQWPRRLLYVLWVTLAQVLTIVVVFVLFIQLYAGWGALFVGIPVAALAASLVGMIVAARLYLPFFGLYALPVLAALLALVALVVFSTSGFAVPWLPVFLGGNALIALATARVPRRGG